MSWAIFLRLRVLGPLSIHTDIYCRRLLFRSGDTAHRSGSGHLRALLGISLCLDGGHGRSDCRLLDRTDTGTGLCRFPDRRASKKYDDAIERNGFATVLYLRLVYFPFTPMNFGMGLTKVRFRDYFSATGLGIIVGTFIFTFFVGTIKDVWASGDWSRLLSFQVFFSIGLFVFSFFIPKIIKKIRKEK